MSEFEKQNAEAFDMVKDGQQLPRKACHFVPEEEYRRLKALERDAIQAEQDREQNLWRENLSQILSAAVKVGAGLLFIGGAAEGLMDPAFAAVTTAGCILWAAGSIKWGKRYA